MRDTRIRGAVADDAADIAHTMRAALSSFDWMPMLHTPGEDLAFIGNHVLPNEQVLVAEADGKVIGFIAVRDEWVNQLYLQPDATGQGVGQRLLDEATFGMDVVKLHCFQANAGARRFYERHGFVAESFGDGRNNEESLPDILYVRRR
ncbi:MAG: N-acetyltransferase family protein [Rhizobiaceae bacterium]